MTILVEVKPEVQAELSRQATAQGKDVRAYVASLLEEAAHLPGDPGTAHSIDLETTLKELAQYSSKIPSLPDEALSRERIYRDHD